MAMEHRGSRAAQVVRPQRFLRDERGTVVVLSAVLLSGLLGFGAIAVDLGYAYAVKGRLQVAAEAASLAAGQKLPDTAAATAAALDLASKNVPAGYGTVVQASDVIFGSYDTSTKAFTANGTPTNAVRVTAGRTTAKGNSLARFLAAPLGLSATQVQASATTYRPASEPPDCVFVLNTGNSNGAMSIGGSGSFKVPNCGVWVNSSHPSSAAQATGAAKAVAKTFCIRGGYSGSFTATPTTGCASAPDPLASVPEPPVPGGLCKTAAQIAGPTWTHGKYCGTVTPSGNVTLGPGTYYFQSATLSLSSGQKLTGQDVTLFFDSDSTLTQSGNSVLDLTAPSSGAQKGIALFQSRSASANNVIQLTGTADFIVAGTLYMPRARLQMTGNSDIMVNSKVGYVIAHELRYTGSSSFTVGTWGGTQALGTTAAAVIVE